MGLEYRILLHKGKRKVKLVFESFNRKHGGMTITADDKQTISPNEWEALRLASIKGVPDSDLAERFGVTREAIRKRRSRDAIWQAAFTPPPGAPGSKEPIEAAKSQEVTKGADSAFLAQKVATTISENAESLSSSNLLLASQIARKGLQRASSEIDHLPLENIADIERIFKMAAIAGKWAQPQVNVQQAFAFGGGQSDDSILECETVIVEDGGNYGDAFNLAGNEGES